MSVIQGDFFQVDWSGGDFLLINSTMFSADLWTRMTERLLEMTEPGCFVLTLSGEIPGCSGLGKDPYGAGACWEKLVAYQTTMSWGRT